MPSCEHSLKSRILTTIYTTDCIDITLENDEFLVDNASFENDLNEFHPESRVSPDLSATSGYILHSKSFSDDDFRIFKTDHIDFRCSVLNKYGRFCENKIDCAKHSLEQKSKVERSDTIERLIRNFKYLQNLKEDILEYSKQLSSKALNDNNFQLKQSHRSEYCYDLKRHNSYQNNQCFTTLNPSINKYSDQFYNQPIQILNSIFKEEDTFANLLTTKLLEINPDPHTRIVEFHYKLKLKNLATLTFYQ